MNAIATLDDLINGGEITIHRYHAVCSHCGHNLGPITHIGLVIYQTLEHILAVDDD